jgi:hypothetical protein
MYKDGVVTFADWFKGMVKHPVYGFGLLKNLEVFENKGIAKINNRTVLDTSITPTQLPLACIKDVNGNIYVATGETGAGVISKNGTALQSGLANVWDMKIYKDYLWVRHANVMSCYGPLTSAGAQWFGNVGLGFNANYRGNIIIGQDDTMYITNGNDISSMTVTAGGVVAVAPTISLNLSALDLPEGQFATCIAEYGRWLMIGTGGGGSYSQMGSFKTARIYPWDRVSASVQLPIIFNENGIQALVQHANRLFAVAGDQGNVYETDSTSYRKIATIPYVETGVLAPMTVFPNAFTVSQKGTLLVGVSVGATYGKSGVYEIDISNSSYPVCLKNTISTGSTNSNSGRIQIGFVYPQDYITTRIGWQDVGSFGVDTTDFRTYADYGAVIETEMVKVGTFNNKKTFEHIEWCLAEPLVSGQNIRISYRLNNKDAYTPVGTWGYSTQGSVLSFEDIAHITDAEYVQLKIELDQALLTVYGSNINLISVRLW